MATHGGSPHPTPGKVFWSSRHPVQDGQPLDPVFLTIGCWEEGGRHSDGVQEWELCAGYDNASSHRG